MRKKSAPGPTPTTTKSGSQTNSEVDLKSEFLSAAFGLSWQLALIVLIPVLGGHFIDDASHKTPLFTVIGLVIAVIGVVMVLKQTLKQVGGVSK